MENFKSEQENLVEMKKQLEQKDGQLLSLEVVISLLSLLAFFAMVGCAFFSQAFLWVRILLAVLGFVVCVLGGILCLKIEQTAGYYECAKCHFKHVPKFSSIFWAMHIGRKRRMRCPNCKEKSWHKKTVKR